MAKNEFSKMTPEQRAECGRIGGISSGISKRKKKAMKETLDVILSMPMKTGKYSDVEDIKNFASIKGKNISVQDALVISMIQRALKGDVRACEWVRDTAGQKPYENMNMTVDIPVVISGDDDLED